MGSDSSTACSCVRGYLAKCRGSKRLILVIVYFALFLDYTLLTVIVPIIPNLLMEAKHHSLINGSCTNVTVTIDSGTSATISNLATSTTIATPTTETMEKTTTPPCVDHNHGESKSEIKSKRKARQKRAQKLTVLVGLIMASKAFVQLLTNPFVGPLTHRIGYSIPMFVGLVSTFVSTLTFAFGNSIWMLIFARAIQGVGSALSSVAGLGMLAVQYPGDEERGNAMGIALGGMALGVVVGPAFGGMMYDFVGRASPFLVLAALALFDGMLQLVVLQPSYQPGLGASKGPSLLDLLKDPYILLAAGALMIANLSFGVLDPSMPLWMLVKMNADSWQQGIAYLPPSLSYLFTTNLCGCISYKIGRWLTTLCGFVLLSVSLVFLPFCTCVWQLFAPMAGIGLAAGMVDSAMMPTMANLVDLRYVSVYGTIYALADVALCLAYCIGPVVSGPLVRYAGFNWMVWIVAIVCFLYSPLLYFLRDPPSKEEKKLLLTEEIGSASEAPDIQSSIGDAGRITE